MIVTELLHGTMSLTQPGKLPLEFLTRSLSQVGELTQMFAQTLV